MSKKSNVDSEKCAFDVEMLLWSQNDRLRPTSIKLAESSESVTRQIEAKSDSWDKSLLSP